LTVSGYSIPFAWMCLYGIRPIHILKELNSKRILGLTFGVDLLRLASFDI